MLFDKQDRNISSFGQKRKKKFYAAIRDDEMSDTFLGASLCTF